jgi:hypothetical protein
VRGQSIDKLVQLDLQAFDVAVAGRLVQFLKVVDHFADNGGQGAPQDEKRGRSRLR